MSDASRSVYVYYRVAPGHALAAQDGVHRLFQALSTACPGLITRLMCKLEGAEAEGDATWMEVYEHPQGLSAEFQVQMQEQAHQLLAHQTGQRHVEVFTPMPSFGLSGLA